MAANFKKLSGECNTTSVNFESTYRTVVVTHLAFYVLNFKQLLHILLMYQ